ncbi:response regulator transcription factor [Rhodopseudomonas sp.]|uniref:helix-turn-helix transcriptional regulator n=1 Tax=Rhodopseudomonas sp. TaxID=1078 RepID=UPI0039E367B0
MLSQANLRQVLDSVVVSAAVIDHSGRVCELSERWTMPGNSVPAARRTSIVGKSYFETCIRPDRHSLDLLRGFHALVDGSIDFFATVHFREVDGARRYFLVMAAPKLDEMLRILVLHLDLSALLAEPQELSAMLVGCGPAATAMLESSMISAVRSVVADALGGRASAQSDIRTPSERRLLEELTRPQIELLSYLAAGLTNDQIARRRKMSINTVKAQVAAVIQKLNVNNRTQAALFAARNSAALGLEIGLHGRGAGRVPGAATVRQAWQR